MEKHCEHKRHSGSFWAYVLIIVGILWILKQSGWDINLPGFGEFFAGIGHFFGNLFQMTAFATVPVLIIFFGIMLILGRKFFGALLLVLLVMIILPHFPDHPRNPDDHLFPGSFDHHWNNCINKTVLKP